MATSAKLFMHGGSQAVRLPKEFRFEGTDVHIRRVGQDVLLSAQPLPSIDALLEALDEFDPNCVLEREQPTFDRRAPIRTRRAAR